MNKALVSKSFTTLTEVERQAGESPSLPPPSRHQIHASHQPMNGDIDAERRNDFKSRLAQERQTGQVYNIQHTSLICPAAFKHPAEDMEKNYADFAGKWKMKSSENFEELLKALGVNVFLRKIAVTAASSPAVEISQQGETLSIKTSTSVRTTHVSFTVGQTFSEATVDGRPCTSFPKWETDQKISCEQTLQKGEGPKTSWTRELTNDGELILTMTAGDVVCTRVYERE